MVFNELLQIPQTLEVVINAWEHAERELQSLTESKHHNLDEECLTKLFYGEFSFLLRKKSEEGKIEQAFLEDLKITFPYFQLNYLEGLSANLIAEVILHNKRTEGVTGGDFGIAISRPQILYQDIYDLELKVSEEVFGLLCQAKLKGDKKWGNLQPNQVKVFPDRLNYLVLLLYSYLDDERKILDSFKWQLCKNFSVPEMIDWLKLNSFPSILQSKDILKSLGNGLIGTNDKEIIKEILKSNKPRFEIKIGWKSGKLPNEDLYLHHYKYQEQNLQIEN